MMRKIIKVHFSDIDSELMEKSIAAFYGLRKLEAIEKKPATRELINWVRALQTDPDFKPKNLAKGELPYLGVLFKKSKDYERAANVTNRRSLY